MSGPTRIVIQPDAPAVLAARLVKRLRRDSFLPPGGTANWRKMLEEAVTEALADEIHQAAVDGTLGGSA